MLTKILSASHFGLEITPVDVEVNIFKKGFPGFNIIGLPNKAVEEARERVKTALDNSGVEFPQAKIVVNLAPADIPKEGAGFDLPIAMGILASLEAIKLPDEKTMFFGELSLDGSLRHTKGVFLLAVGAKKLKVKHLFVPKESAAEGSVVEGINVYPVASLNQIVEHLNNISPINPAKSVPGKEPEELVPEFDFSEIVGQAQAKRAM
jgi:magnesium chelatase family protein